MPTLIGMMTYNVDPFVGERKTRIVEAEIGFQVLVEGKVDHNLPLRCKKPTVVFSTADVTDAA
jgi:hypothetical protein